jgi:hypothetical protein
MDSHRHFVPFNNAPQGCLQCGYVSALLLPGNHDMVDQLLVMFCSENSTTGVSLDSSSTCMEESLDDVQARKAALSFLCRINADYMEIQHFLQIFPDALLFGLEDEGRLEESLIKQMHKCKCFAQSCNQNRQRIIRVLRKGFEFYRGVGLSNSNHGTIVTSVGRGRWDTYSIQLRNLQRDFRLLQKEDIGMENLIFEAIGEVDDLRFQLNAASKLENFDRPGLYMLICRKVKADEYDERAILETQLAVANLRISTVEKDYKLLQSRKRAAKRLQHSLFNTIFAECTRHVCNTSRIET